MEKVGEEYRERICEAAQAARARARDEPDIGEPTMTPPRESKALMLRVLSRENLIRALKQVQRNKGAPGIDGMSVEALPEYLKTHWLGIKEQLMAGRYRPKPVLRVQIAKPDGGIRALGISTVVDRLLQQAIAQVLQGEWDATFHDASYGFRPRRNAHQALRQSQSQIQAGYCWVVDCDLDSFFDTVNHDRVMHRLKQRVADSDVLRLINRFLKAGVQVDGLRQASEKGLPQGGPLSPILSNIVLDELDGELDRRGHKFVRYADDVQVYVKSKAAGDRVMCTLTRYLEDSLRLTVNTRKSAVARPWERTFLGCTFSRRRGHKIKASDKAIARLKSKVRVLSRRSRGHKMSQVIAELTKTLLGWKAYFGIAEVLSPLRDLDKWIRRRLRSYHWKQWGRAGYRQFRRRGVDRQLAWNNAKSAHGPWRLSASPALTQALPNRYFNDLGLPELAAR